MSLFTQRYYNRTYWSFELCFAKNKKGGGEESYWSVEENFQFDFGKAGQSGFVRRGDWTENGFCPDRLFIARSTGVFASLTAGGNRQRR